jgi:hypothetical protein
VWRRLAASGAAAMLLVFGGRSCARLCGSLSKLLTQLVGVVDALRVCWELSGWGLCLVVEDEQCSKGIQGPKGLPPLRHEGFQCELPLVGTLTGEFDCGGLQTYTARRNCTQLSYKCGTQHCNMLQSLAKRRNLSLITRSPIRSYTRW